MKKTELRLIHIVACSENNVIGRDGKMPWHLSTDLKFFKTTTMGHIMVMGRKTYESIGRPLPGRKTLVISRRSDWQVPEGVEVVDSVEAALSYCRTNCAEWGPEVFVVGGGEIYRQTMGLVARVYLTRIHVTVKDGDTVYPAIDAAHFREEARVDGQEGDLRFTFFTYDRIDE